MYVYIYMVYLCVPLSEPAARRIWDVLLCLASFRGRGGGRRDDKRGRRHVKCFVVCNLFTQKDSADSAHVFQEHPNKVHRGEESEGGCEGECEFSG